MIHGKGATSLNLKGVGHIVYPVLSWLRLSNGGSYSLTGPLHLLPG